MFEIIKWGGFASPNWQDRETVCQFRAPAWLGRLAAWIIIRLTRSYSVYECE